VPRLDELSSVDLERAFDAGTIVRGRSYAHDGHVTALTVHPERSLLQGEVRGASREPYTTVVTWTSGSQPGQTTIDAHCTCPVRRQCKHAVALIVAAQEGSTIPTRAPATPSAWKRPLQPLLRADSARPLREASPLALRFTLERPEAQRRHVASAVTRTKLTIRPVVLGMQGGWNTTNAAWQDMEYQQHDAGQMPEHRAFMRELRAASRPRNAGYGNYGNQTEVDLADVGPGLWRLLERADDLGVELVPENPDDGPVEVEVGAAVVTVDLSRDATSGDITLVAVATVEGPHTETLRLDGPGTELLGSPAHGLFTWSDDPARPPRIRLVRFTHPLRSELGSFVSQHEAVVVPDVDVREFFHDFYPRLAMLATLTSADGTVVLPEIIPPRARLTVGYPGDGTATLDWGFTYVRDDQTYRVDLVPGPNEPLVRDSEAERRLLRDLEVPPRLAPAPRLVLHGYDVVMLAEEQLPKLRAAGQVDIVVVGDEPTFREAEHAPVVHMQVRDTEAGRDWFDLGIEISVDDETIRFNELFVALASGQTHLVLPTGTWLPIDRPEFAQLQALIDEARMLHDSPPDELRISRYQATLWDDLAALGVLDVQSQRWQRSVQGLADVDNIEPVPLPAGLRAELRPYQHEGYTWLSFLYDHELGGVLADDMGLGKTVQTLALMCRVREADPTARFLVVAPTSVVDNWAREAAKFAPDLPTATIHQTLKRRGVPLAEATAGAGLVLTSYALFRLEFEAYAAETWSGLVLDEAQFVKNHQSKAYRCARTLDAPFKLAITGTPLENGLMDLWALLSIVAPGLYPEPRRFTETFVKPIERGEAPELLATLRRRIRPVMRRRTKDDVLIDLPPKQEQVLDIALSEKHAKIYQTHLQRERTKVLGLLEDVDRNRFEILRSLTLLRQLSLDPALVDEAYEGVGSAKIDVLVDQLTEIVAEGHKALVFSQFTGFLARIRKRLDAEGITYAYLDGSTRDRSAAIDSFKDGEAPVFLISLKAGGFGLNLTEADYCFVLDPWWNPATEAQAVDRAHRIGQSRTVMVYRFVASDTIEEKVMELKARKQQLFASVMDGDGELAGALDARDIRALLD